MTKYLMSLVLSFVLALPAQALDQLYFTPYQNPYSDLIAMINKADKSILIGAYGFNNVELVDAIIDAMVRKVTVSLVVDSSQSGLKNQKAALLDLKQSGAYIHIGRSAKNRIMHAKFIIVDEKVEADGSFNFTSEAHLQNNTMTISDDPERVKKFVEFWHQIDSDMVDKKQK